jgi:hypothetical protein
MCTFTYRLKKYNFINILMIHSQFVLFCDNTLGAGQMFDTELSAG